MDPRPPLYDPFVRLLRAASPLLGRGSSKLARGIRGRREAVEVLAAWGRDGRDPGRPLVWFHAPSVGEGLQARAVMEELRRRRPELQLVFTHFSPSAEGLAARVPADVAGYLPWDDRPGIAAVLDTLRPDLIAFTKTEVWPGLASEARARSIPITLVAATLPAGAGRLRRPAARILRRTFGALDGVMAVGRDDARRFGRLGVPPDRVEVCGDPAVDSAWARARGADPDAPHLAALRRRRRPTLVAGSTWPPDEDILFRSLPGLRKSVPRARVVVAPHEPHAEHVEKLLARFEDQGWDAATLGDMERVRGTVGGSGGEGSAPPGDISGSEGTLSATGPGADDAADPSTGTAPDDDDGPEGVVVERVGVLAELYTVADAAYVGGGFHRHGLHSVLEPAAAGLPVLFGPRHHNAPAAGELVARGGAQVVRDARGLADVAASWLGRRETREVVARAASEYIGGQRGAAARTAQALGWLLDRADRRRGGGAP